MNRFNRTSISLIHVHRHFTPQKNQFIVWDKIPWTSELGSVFSDKVKLCSAAGIPTGTTIRTCYIKALGFQRLSFTANVRSPGSYVSRQLIKDCFHPHLPNSTPQILSHHHWTAVITNPLIWCLDFSTEWDILRPLLRKNVVIQLCRLTLLVPRVD